MSAEIGSDVRGDTVCHHEGVHRIRRSESELIEPVFVVENERKCEKLAQTEERGTIDEPNHERMLPIGPA